VKLGAIGLASALILTACGKSSTPSEPTGCLRVDGAYSFTVREDACGITRVSDGRTVALVQDGCEITAVLPGYGLLLGSLDGSNVVFSITLLVSDPRGCGNAHLSGTGTFSAPAGHLVLTGTYGTAAAPPAGCGCLPPPNGATLRLES
jgi:hypothetical protein